jgi:hypothetical protein
MTIDGHVAPPRTKASGPCQEPMRNTCTSGDDTAPKCAKPSTTCCVDTWHARNDVLAMCQGCVDSSRNKLLLRPENPLSERDILASRAYLCEFCISKGLKGFYNSVFWVWGRDTRTTLGEVASRAPDMSGGFRGSVAELTGCGCGRKLLAADLCNEHRLDRVKQWQDQVASTKTWVGKEYAKKECPKCRLRRGVDRFNFRGKEGGGELDRIAWACLVCREFVFVDREARTSVLPGVEKLAPVTLTDEDVLDAIDEAVQTLGEKMRIREGA